MKKFRFCNIFNFTFINFKFKRIKHEFLIISDNPLICDCELVWYADWLKSLRGKDDEMMQKKRIVCTMGEHREYDLQNLPLDVMGCVNKNMGRTSLNGGNQNNIHLYYFSLLVTFGTVALGNNFNYYYVF